jgi:hypothetical protein
MPRENRGISAPATMGASLLDHAEEELYWDATGNPRRSLHADAGRRPALLSEEQKWEAQNTVAFWAATFFLQGSLLFTIGSIALYPSVLTVCSEDTKTEDCSPEFMYLAWVDYSFLIGAWCFTIGNYLVYFQVINSDKSSSEPFSLFARPVMDGGHLGAIFNLIGSLLFNWNTMLMFDTANHDSVWYEYNLVYVMSGGLGSVFVSMSILTADSMHVLLTQRVAPFARSSAFCSSSLSVCVGRYCGGRAQRLERCEKFKKAGDPDGDS